MASWQEALLILAVILILLTSAFIYWRTSDSYRIMQAKKKLGYEVMDFKTVMGKCLRCFFGPIYKKNWEKKNKHFRNDDYGSADINWVENADNNPDWTKLPRGDHALRHKLTSTAVAKSTTRIMEEIWTEALVGALAAYIADLKADYAAHQKLEELRQKALEMQNSEEQLRREEAAREEEERKEAEEMAAEDDKQIEQEESQQLMDLETANAADNGVLLNGHMLQARPESMLISDPGTPIMGASQFPYAATGATTTASTAVIAKLGSLSNPVTLAELRRHTRHPETAALLELEFKSIPTNLTTIAELHDGAISQCRNTTYLPTLSSLVCIKHDEDDDDELDIFIDANYVYGPDGQAERYIIAATPMIGEPGKDNTTEAFWQLVFEKRVSTIVMMQENKTSQYWPSKQERMRTCGRFCLTWESEQSYEGYMKTELFVSVPNETAIKVTHFLFSDWPAEGVPTNTAPLLSLIHEVHECTRTVTRPVLVHSDIAAGPASVFIAVEHGIFQIETQPYVDILRLVAELRIDRGGCVHTVDEYDIIHKALCMYSLALSKVPAPPTYIPTPKFDEAPPPEFSDDDDDADDDSKGGRVKMLSADDRKKSIYAPLSHEEALRAISGKRESVDVLALGPAPLLPEDDDDFDVAALGGAPALPSNANSSMSMQGVPQWKRDFMQTGISVTNTQPCVNCNKAATTQCSSCPAVYCTPCDKSAHSHGDNVQHTRRLMTGLDVPPPCASCDVSAATLHCQQCDADFCDSCDSLVVHNVGLARNHTRLPISGAAKATASASNTTLCGVCNATTAAFACKQCMRPMCTSCDRMVHSSKMAENHDRTPIVSSASMRHFSNASLHAHGQGNV